MSTTGRVRHDGASLAPRAVRLRNHYLRQAARARGLREPLAQDLIGLSPGLSLSEALGWWEREQRTTDPDHSATDQFAEMENPVARRLKRMAVIGAMVVFALMFFPATLNGA